MSRIYDNSLASKRIDFHLESKNLFVKTQRLYDKYGEQGLIQVWLLALDEIQDTIRARFAKYDPLSILAGVLSFGLRTYDLILSGPGGSDLFKEKLCRSLHDFQQLSLEIINKNEMRRKMVYIS